VSIAANVAHSFIPPAGSSPDWRPEPGAVVGAVVWPVFLFVAVEILIRVQWTHGLGWRITRWAGLLPVAGLAALVSYRHLSGLLAHYGEEPIVYYTGPLAVDGLMMMATAALWATGKHRHNAPNPVGVHQVSAPAAAPTTGGLASAPTIPTPPPAPVVAPVKPDQPAPSAPAVTPAVLAQRVTPTRPTSPPGASATPAKPGIKTATRPRPSKKATPPAARPAPSSTDTSVTAFDRARPTDPVVVPPELLARVRGEADKYQAEHGVPISPGQLAVRLRVTSEQAQQALAVLNLNQDRQKASPTVNGSLKAAR
jgi:hypothetical protein